MKEIKIYCLYEPHTCKIRYIGRTISSLNTRLTQHICKAKNNYSNCYKENWIRKLLKNGIRPKIKLLKVLNCTWEQSHLIEKEIIQRHLLKHKLVNGDDRGPGNLSKNINPIIEQQRVEKIKRHFNNENNKYNFYNKLYCYDSNGNYIKEYKSRKFVVEELGLNPNSITNQVNRFDNYKMNVLPINGLYFSKYKYNKLPLNSLK